MYHPIYGWQTLNFENPEVAEKCSQRQTNQPISELVILVEKSGKEGHIYMPFSEEAANWIMRGIAGPPLRPAVHISLNQIFGIIDKVRNIILEWSIQLEQRGILGEGMTFSTREKVAASSVTQITNIIDSISNSSILQNSPGAIQITQVFIEKPDKEDLSEFSDKLERLIKQVAAIDRTGLNEELDKLKLRLDTIRLYLSSEQQDPSFIEESLRTTRGVLEGLLSSSIVAAALHPGLHKLIGELLNQLIAWLG